MRPRADVVEPQQQVDDRGLARAGRPDDADALAGLDDERHVAEHVVVVVIGEPDVFERDTRRCARSRGGCRRCSRRSFDGSGRLIATGVSSSWKIRSDDAIAPCRTLNFSDRS